MTERAGWATLDIIPSVRGLRQDLERGTAADLTAAGRTGGKRYGQALGDEAGKSFKGRFSNAMRGFAPLAGLAAGAGVATLFSDVINSASEAQQAVGGVQAVFGDYADSVLADSARAAEGLGLSAEAYNRLITISGALLKNKGLEDFADRAEDLVSIGADLAAQFGGSTQQAVEALNAALRGESDPIERYAISLNETAVNAELARQGHEKLTGAALDQAKTQARLALIVQQSADAQGAFARESDTLAGQQARVSAEWANMRAELGTKLLPVLTDVVGFTNSSVLPALQDMGGVVVDAGRAFGSLPGPVKTATAALVAFRLAQAAGVTGGLASGAQEAGRAFDNLRQRLLVTRDAYGQARTASIQLTNTGARFNDSLSRTSAGLQAVRVGAQGAGSAMRRGLGGAVNMLGGPWGLAIAGATAAIGYFWQEHQKAEAAIDEFMSTLDKETGALTESSREWAAKRLLDEGVLQSAKNLGIELSNVTDAALGQSGALDKLRDSLNSIIDAGTTTSGSGTFMSQQARDAEALLGVLNDTNGIVRTSAHEQELLAAASRDVAEATGDSAGENARASAAIQTYATSVDAARKNVLGLLRAENARRDSQLQDRRDRIALLDQLASTRQELREGKKTLDENTKAGRENMSALLDLADQWNNSGRKVKNAKGAYEDMRQQFIDLATAMGGGTDSAAARAQRLADNLLKLPKNKAIKVDTPGMDKALEDLRRLRALATLDRVNIQTQIRGGNEAFASGGLIGGYGSGTSDSNLIWASRGEFMQRKAAVDYYGVEFMRKLNALQIPRFAQGGPIAPAPAPRQPIVNPGPTIYHYGDIITERPRDYVADVKRRALGGVPMGRGR